jgi:hypothetical protein
MHTPPHAPHQRTALQQHSCWFRLSNAESWVMVEPPLFLPAGHNRPGGWPDSVYSGRRATSPVGQEHPRDLPRSEWHHRSDGSQGYAARGGVRGRQADTPERPEPTAALTLYSNINAVKEFEWHAVPSQ